jgi:hypothetical protein
MKFEKVKFRCGAKKLFLHSSCKLAEVSPSFHPDIFPFTLLEGNWKIFLCDGNQVGERFGILAFLDRPSADP